MLMDTKIIFASGGLGNQLFQYAYYLLLLKQGYNAKLNLDSYKITKQHNGWEVSSIFNIKPNITPTSYLSVLKTKILGHFKFKFCTLKETNYMGYDSKWLSPSKRYLIGCWINPKYVNPIELELKRILKFTQIDDYNRSLVDKMKKENSISLHIRRGDFLKSTYYNVCDSKYYTTAINIIKDKLKNPKFYIFSDEPEWCREFIKQFDVDFEIIDHNRNEESYKDMFLISQCNSNIIANSNFSWWCAWLNENKNKIVIAPKIWSKRITNSPNIESWICI